MSRHLAASEPEDGVAIAEHQLFVAAGGLSYVSAPGYVIAYGGG